MNWMSTDVQMPPSYLSVLMKLVSDQYVIGYWMSDRSEWAIQTLDSRPYNISSQLVKYWCHLDAPESEVRA